MSEQVNHRRTNRKRTVGKPCHESHWYGLRRRCNKECRYCSDNRTAKNRRRSEDSK